MVGSPYQTEEHPVNDLLFLKELQPHMVGIGPFIHHNDTSCCVFSDETRISEALTVLKNCIITK